MKMSSKPTTAMSCGTATPASRSAAIAPIAIRSLAAKKALGRFGRASTLAAAVRPPTSLNSAPVTMSAKDYDTGGIALLKTLEAALGEDFTPAVRGAWAACYEAIVGEMKAAAAEVGDRSAA